MTERGGEKERETERERAREREREKKIQGDLAHKNPPSLGPYGSPVLRDLW